jgi:excisionase family DNA binding protein
MWSDQCLRGVVATDANTPTAARYRERGPMNDETPVMTCQEVANYLKCHRSSIYRMLKDGLLPAWRVGSDYRFLRTDIDKWRLAQEATYQVAKAKESTNA